MTVERALRLKEHYGWAWTRTSRNDFLDRLAMVDVEAFAAGDFQAAGIEPELLQDRGVDVGDVVAILDGVEADFVGRAMHDAALESAAGHPDGEAEDVMVATVRSLRTRSATELGGEDDERFVEQAATVEILQQAADRLVDRERSCSCDWPSDRRVRPTRPRHPRHAGSG